MATKHPDGTYVRYIDYNDNHDMGMFGVVLRAQELRYRDPLGRLSYNHEVLLLEDDETKQEDEDPVYDLDDDELVAFTPTREQIERLLVALLTR